MQTSVSTNARSIEHADNAATRTPTFTKVHARVRCQGKYHTIDRDSRGRLVFYNHTTRQLRRDLAIAELGGRPCRCAVAREFLLEAIRNGKTRAFYWLPDPLQRVAEEGYAKHRKRMEKSLTRDWLTLPLLERPQSAVALIHQLLCRHAGVPRTVRSCFNYDSKLGTRTLILQPQTGIRFEFPLDENWVRWIYRPGFAWIDNAVTTMIESVRRINSLTEYKTIQCRAVLKAGQLWFVEESNVIYQQHNGKWVAGVGVP